MPRDGVSRTLAQGRGVEVPLGRGVVRVFLSCSPSSSSHDYPRLTSPSSDRIHPTQSARFAAASQVPQETSHRPFQPCLSRPSTPLVANGGPAARSSAGRKRWAREFSFVLGAARLSSEWEAGFRLHHAVAFSAGGRLAPASIVGSTGCDGRKHRPLGAIFAPRRSSARVLVNGGSTATIWGFVVGLMILGPLARRQTNEGPESPSGFDCFAPS